MFESPLNYFGKRTSQQDDSFAPPKKYQAWNQFFHRLFEDKAENYADKPALSIIHSLATEPTSLSYRELNQQANRLAHYLIEHGIGRGQLIAILVEQNMADFISMMLAILKTGAAYVPINARMEDNVINQTLNAAQPDVVLSQQVLPINLNASCQKIVVNDLVLLSHYPTDNPPTSASIAPDDLAYVMYTSGSTGTPKGAAILHRGLPYCLRAHVQTLQLTEHDRVAQLAQVGFDASLAEIMMALGVGATLCVISPELRDDSAFLTQVLQQENITQAIFVPSKLRTLEPNTLPSLTTIIVAGEKFEEDLLIPWHQAGKKMINGYGLTETTICTTLGEYTGQGLDIGKPIIGTELFLLKPLAETPEGFDFKSVPLIIDDDTEGELYIAGMSLAQGYWRDDERTRQRFVEITVAPGQSVRAYRTGDLAKRLAKGAFQITGRIDNQIKLRGQRLEPEHIEEWIKRYQPPEPIKIQQACVVDANEDGNVHLVAYLELQHDREESEEAIISDKNIKYFLNGLRYFLKANLPHFMVPNAYGLLDRLPTNRNGKIDRKALRAIRPIPFLHIALEDSPVTEAERCLAEIWAEKLNYEPEAIKRYDDFFCLGGSSLVVSPLLEALKANTHLFPNARQLTPEDIYQASSLKSMARRASGSPLQLLHKGENDKPPLFLVHSFLGDGWTEYTGFIEKLKPLQHSLYAFKAYGLNEAGDLDRDLTELAADYVNVLLSEHKIPSNQPIILIGWSSGGIIAFAMAQCLKQKKYPVQVVLLDSALPHQAQPTQEKLIQLAQLLAKKLAGFTIPAQVMAAWQENGVCEQAIFDYLQEAIRSDNTLKQLHFARWLLTAEYAYAAQLKQLKNTNKQIFLPDNLVLLKAQIPLFSQADDYLGWPREWLNNHHKTIPGCHHFNLLEQSDCAIAISEVITHADYQLQQQTFAKVLKALYQPALSVPHLLSENDEQFWLMDEKTYISVSLAEVVKKPLKNSKKPSAAEKTTAEQERWEIKGPITLEELIKNQSGHQRILIQGVAGSGKTLLTQFLAQQWSRGYLWQQKGIAYVIRLSLRELHLQQNTTLAELIYKQCANQLPFKPLEALHFLEPLIQEHAHQILWLLDGFDEVVDSFTNHQHPLRRLLQQLCQQPKVILTARPEYADLLQFEYHVYNLGFNDKGVKKYIQQFFWNDEARQKQMEAWLKYQPNMNYFLQVPIIVKLVCTLAKADQLTENLRITQLYQQIVQLLMDYHWQKNQSASDYPVGYSEPHHIREAVQECLELVAFTAIQQKQRGIVPGTFWQKAWQTITDEYDEDITDSQRNCKHLGLRQILEQSKLANHDWFSYVRRSGVLREVQSADNPAKASYEFIHLSFQEYFAACYLARQLPKSCIERTQPSEKIIPRTETEQFMLNNGVNRQHRLLMRFIAGLLAKHQDNTSLTYYFQLIFQSDVINFDNYDVSNHIFLIASYYDEAELPAIGHWGNWIVNTCRFKLQTPEHSFPDSLFFNSISDEMAEKLQQAKWVYSRVKNSQLSGLTFFPFKRIFKQQTDVIIQQLLDNLKDNNAETVCNTAKLLIGLGITKDRLVLPLQQCLQDKDAWIVVTAAQLLIQLGITDKRLIRPLLQQLQDKDPWIVATAAESLIKLGITDERLTLTLLLRLQDKDPRIFLKVAESLIKLSITDERLTLTLLLRLQDKDPCIVATAAESLIKLGITDERITRPQLQRLQDKDPRIVATAAESLIKLGITDERLTRPLLQQLQDKDPWIVATATESLIKLDITDERLTLPLLQQLQNTNASIVVKAAESLIKLGITDEGLTRPLLLRLQDKDPCIVATAAESLIKLGITDERLTLPLLQRLQDKDPCIVATATESLIKLGIMDERLTLTLLLRLQDKDASIVVTAAELLIKLSISDERLTLPLLQRLQDKDPCIVATAAQLLIKLGITDERLIRPLLQQLQDTNASIVATATESLIKLDITDERLTLPLLQQLQDTNASIVVKAAESLIKLGITDERLTRPLLQRLQDKHAWIIAKAAGSLIKLGITDERLTLSLLLRLQDKNHRIVAKAAGSLIKLGIRDERLTLTLLQRLQDKDPRIVAKAAQLLIKLGITDEQLTRPLLQRLQDKDACIVATAAESLIKLGITDERLTLPLLRRLQDKDSSIVAKAAKLLIQLGITDERQIQPLLQRLQDNKADIVAFAASVLIFINITNEHLSQALLMCPYDKNIIAEPVVDQQMQDSMIGILNIYLATLYLQQKDLTKAIVHYLQAHEYQLKPATASKVSHALGYCYHVQNNFKKAEQYYLQALKLNPRAAISYCDYGLLLMKCQRLPAAIGMLHKALENSSQSSILYYDMLRRDLLDHYLQQEITNENNLELKTIFLAYYWLIDCYQQLQQPEQAHTYLTALTKHVEAEFSPLHHRLLSYARQKLGIEIITEKHSKKALSQVNNQIAFTKFTAQRCISKKLAAAYFRINEQALGNDATLEIIEDLTTRISNQAVPREVRTAAEVNGYYRTHQGTTGNYFAQRGNFWATVQKLEETQQTDKNGTPIVSKPAIN